MEELARTVDAALYELDDARNTLDLVPEQLETAMEIAGRDIPSKSA
jgi:hypothetical protein